VLGFPNKVAGAELPRGARLRAACWRPALVPHRAQLRWATQIRGSIWLKREIDAVEVPFCPRRTGRLPRLPFCFRVPAYTFVLVIRTVLHACPRNPDCAAPESNLRHNDV